MLDQILAVTALNLRTLPSRLGPAAVAVVGIAGVVLILVGVLSIGAGFEAAMTNSASDDTAIVLRAGATSELVSGLSIEEARIIGDSPGLAATAAGQSATSPEAFVIVDLAKKSTGTAANVPLRGVEPAAVAMRPELTVIEGRMFEPGTREVIVGRGAAGQFEGLEVGSRPRWGENEWTVVGHFSAGGGAAESELWADAKVLLPAYRRGGYQSVYAKLASPESFEEFRDALTADPRLQVEVERESDYYAQQSRLLTGIIETLGTVIALVMGLGAAFGALNTMYSAVSRRTREIATLRALGFRSGPVVVSVLAEALLLGLIGGALGAGLAYAAFHGFTTSTINWNSFSQVAFSFAVTPALLVRGIVYALVIGLIGGLLPAIRAARQPVATALREL